MARNAEHLSQAQLDALRLAANGLTSREAGRVLGISEDAVNLRLKAAARTLGARNRLHAVVTAARLGLLDLNDTRIPAPKGHAA